MPGVSRQCACFACWNSNNPDRPVPEGTLDRGPDEICCYCGRPTNSGIYTRVYNDDVPYPQTQEDA